MANKFSFLRTIFLAAFFISIGIFIWQFSNSHKGPLEDEITQPSQATFTQLKLDGQEFTVEVANTPALRQQGLSGRDEIGSDGVLFVFPGENYHTFWMKEMKFDLDFIWINGGEVIDITTDVPAPAPGQALVDLPTYTSKDPATAMLEVPAGFAARHNIHVGSAVVTSNDIIVYE